MNYGFVVGRFDQIFGVQLSQESVSAVVAGIEGSSEEDAQEWLQAGA